MKKYLIGIIIIIVLAVIIGGGYFGYQKYLSPTVNWKTYTNTEYGFEFKYPEVLTKQEATLMSNFGQLNYFRASAGNNTISIGVWNTSTYSYDELKQPPPGGINPDTIQQENINFMGYSAVKFSYTSVSDASGGVPTQKISFMKNQLVYIIECHRQDCNQILSTFKFID